MDYRASLGSALGFLQKSAQSLGRALPGPELKETATKLEAFRLFASVAQDLRLPETLPSLPELIRFADRLPAWQRSFSQEGITHHYVNKIPPAQLEAGLLADPELPETAMVPMHAGLGLSLAMDALDTQGLSPSADELEGALTGFIEGCRAHSRPGWAESAIEGLGLAVRTTHPHLRNPVSEVLGQMDPTAQYLFWHGLGRSLYFLPKHFLSIGNSHERALESAVREAPTPECRRNAVAGLVWAVTLVNIKSPEIVEAFLRKAAPLRMPEAFTNGVISALMVWKHMVPDGDHTLTPYLRSVSPSGIHGGRWHDLIAEPARQAFEMTFPVLIRPVATTGSGAFTPTIGSLFQYHETGMPDLKSLSS